jgi:hypothetical protein
LQTLAVRGQDLKLDAAITPSGLRRGTIHDEASFKDASAFQHPRVFWIFSNNLAGFFSFVFGGLWPSAWALLAHDRATQRIHDQADDATSGIVEHYGAYQKIPGCFHSEGKSFDGKNP